MASTDMTLHIELSGLDRELLERTCENLEWYRKYLQEHRSDDVCARSGAKASSD